MLQFNELRASTAQEYPIGTLFWNPTASGAKAYLYCLMDAGGATSDGMVCLVDPSTYGATMATTANAAPGTGTGKLVGISRRTVPASNYCWLQVYGPSLVQVLTLAAAFTQLNTTATSGVLDDDATVGARVIDGIALTAARGAGTGTAAGFLNFPNVAQTL